MNEIMSSQYFFVYEIVYHIASQITWSLNEIDPLHCVMVVLSSLIIIHLPQMEFENGMNIYDLNI